MTVKVLIPTPLRRFTGETGLIELEAKTVAEVLEAIDHQYPGFRNRLLNEDGQLRRFFNIYVDGEDVRFLQDLATTIPSGAEVSIVPAISGGNGAAASGPA